MGTDKKTVAKNTNAIKIIYRERKKVYADQCLVCHQADGGGGAEYESSIDKTKWVLGDKPN